MIAQIKTRMESLPFKLDRKLLVPAIGGVALLITGAIVLMLWRSSQGYVALFGSQEQVPVAQVVEVLSNEALTYRVNPGNGEILVREDELSKARMLLAAKGISALRPEGYELMDKEEVLGTSQFMQNVRYKRSLEGELAQSIMSMDPVQYARVHLGINESSSFVVSTRDQSSASVMVRLRYGEKLDQQQVASIVQLVAGSVPGMKPEQVRVVDQHGELLSDMAQLKDGSGYSVKNGNEAAQRIQRETENRVANLLRSVVGDGNYRISVMPQMDLSSVEETQERYNGEPRVSTENINQENSTDEIALGVPGSLSNRPANTAAPAPGLAPNRAGNNNNAPQALSSRNQAQRQYAYDRDIRHIRYPGYRLTKLSVAIALNKNAPLLQGWTAEQQAQLDKLIADAAGIDNMRGDSLTVSQMAFVTPVVETEPVLKWWQDPAIIKWVEMAGIGLLALLILLFGVRRFSGKKKSEETSVQLELLRDEETGELLPESAALAQGLPRGTFNGEDSLPPQSSGLETKIAHLQLLAQNETERVAEVIKQWINSNERSRTR
ncbi:MAG: flagellar basal-body MS-ring/collar protein FliF [Enterobacteriaceae bacterium]